MKNKITTRLNNRNVFATGGPILRLHKNINLDREFMHRCWFKVRILRTIAPKIQVSEKTPSFSTSNDTDSELISGKRIIPEQLADVFLLLTV